MAEPRAELCEEAAAVLDGWSVLVRVVGVDLGEGMHEMERGDFARAGAAMSRVAAETRTSAAATRSARSRLSCCCCRSFR